MYGHQKLKLMDGGRKKWLDENRPTTKDAPKRHGDHLQGLRAQPGAARQAARGRRTRWARSPWSTCARPPSSRGEILAPPGLPETAQRGGHIPGAANVPWGQAVAEDGTFKPIDDAEGAVRRQGRHGDKDIIAYCRIGERSSHTWFVLQPPARLPERPELRRLLDGVGQHDRRPGREALARTTERMAAPGDTYPVRLYSLTGDGRVRVGAPVSLTGLRHG